MFGIWENQRGKLKKSKGGALGKDSSPPYSVWKQRKSKEKEKAP